MQFSTLVSVLALLATTTPVLSRTSHPHAAGAHRRHLAKQQARVENAVLKREIEEQYVRDFPARAVEPKRRRTVKNRRGASCRARTTTTSASAAETDSATPTPTDDSAVTATGTPTDAVAAEIETASSVESESASGVPNNQYYAPTQAATTSSSTANAAATSSSTSPAAAAATTAASSSSGSSSDLTPNGIKAGIAGGDAYDQIKDHIGWWYDWSAVPSGHSGAPIAVNMVWGAGTLDGTDSSRMSAFKAITTPPKYIMGFEEPDCSTQGSANMDIATGASVWNSVIAPWKSQGSLLISPSMCHQKAEEYIQWLAGFTKQISTPFDIVNLHINKNSMEGVKADLDYYWSVYQKPMWVTEFACVDDSSSFIPCTDQGEINSYINDIVDLFEADDRVYAYAYSNGEGLGDVWPMTVNGALTQSGQTYINAVSKYH
ncbi:hypothetical protein CI109_104931 [Kwoniella shandongensis]|uniref:Uncharacterized protein n=1 Tax=Kwoniella shandongensis TaxID=1734106 RepID=A0A5M6BWJ5_9TREE|nr:uncharacterized protein CI109_006278 [Kwoniella shandongensis]KAA5525379.1 hypothetical protein CI109_006278 [Kwoniella shandongensis]